VISPHLQNLSSDVATCCSTSTVLSVTHVYIKYLHLILCNSQKTALHTCTLRPALNKRPRLQVFCTTGKVCLSLLVKQTRTAELEWLTATLNTKRLGQQSSMSSGQLWSRRAVPRILNKVGATQVKTQNTRQNITKKSCCTWTFCLHSAQKFN